MFPRFALKMFVFAFLVVCCGQPKQQSLSNEVDNRDKPNIVYILADDLGYGDLSCYGQKFFQTPNIDRLAQEGMMFNQHYSGSTVCAPSRSCLMTGLHTGHTYIRGNKEVRPEGQYPLADSIVTLAELLQEQGYYTGAFGKWGLGPPGSEGDPLNQGFDEFFGYNCQRLAHHYYPRHLWDNDEKLMIPENEGLKKGLYAPEIIQEKTLDFIEENKDQPFFLFVPTVIPHAELAAPEEIMKKHRGKFLPEKEYEGTDQGDQYREGPYESQKESHAAFAAMIEVLDSHVGQILDKISSLGLSENTLIMFTSDNGPHLEGGADPDYFDSNGPLKGYKRDLYEGGIRVPMLARFTGKIEPGSTANHISAFWDVMPTLLELAGANEMPSIDGLSFLPTLMGEETQEKHEYLYWEFHERDGRVAVRQGDWKLVKYDVKTRPEAPAELYNLAEDLGENNNLASTYPQLVSEMIDLMQQARTPSPIFTFESQGFLQEQ